jgi:hypothetical protein
MGPEPQTTETDVFHDGKRRSDQSADGSAYIPCAEIPLRGSLRRWRKAKPKEIQPTP